MEFLILILFILFITSFYFHSNYCTSLTAAVVAKFVVLNVVMDPIVTGIGWRIDFKKQVFKQGCS